MMNSFSCLRAYGDSVKGLPRCQVATPRNGWWSSGAAPSNGALLGARCGCWHRVTEQWIIDRVCLSH